MSVIKLRTFIACPCCRQWARAIKPRLSATNGFTGMKTSPIQAFNFRFNSGFTKHTWPTTSFTLPDSNSKKWPQASTRKTAYSPACTSPVFHGDILFRSYSISPQPQQKDDPSGPTGDAKDQTQTTSPSEPSEGEPSTAVENEADEASKGILERFKDAYKNYGKVLIGVHCATSAVWFSSFYYAAYMGIDVVPLLKWIGLSDRFISPFESSGIGNVAVAYLLYKVATPARYTVTILGTRNAVKYLRKTGFMEPVPEGSRIRDLVKESRQQVRGKYEDLKDEVKEKRDEYKEKIEEKRDEFKEKIEEKRDEFKDKLKKRQE